MPKVKTKLNIRSFPPWAKYEATSKVFDLTLIELSAEFQVSKKESQKIFSVAALEINYIQIQYAVSEVIYHFNYGLSIIMSNVSQIISVMKT